MERATSCRLLARCRIAMASIAACLCLQPAAAENRELLVFAAASLQGSLDAVIVAWGDVGGAPVKVAYASSSTLARQIEQGAEADIYVSANTDWMDYLEERGLLRPSTRSDLLGNALVLIAPAASGLRIRIGPGFDPAGALGDGRFAMGDPDHVPAGIYGREALEHYGVWDAVRDRVARASDVRAALALVSRGETPLGIVYRSDAAADANVRIVDTFPAASHAPIVYPVAIVASSANPDAESLVDFLQSAQAAADFERHGFASLR